ncbi:hypothetical protein C8Q80DRAFT_1101423 [Daedaleopsis nitida]|nr:hypothetical protein C8Q80DRAFT_1101423 [Daedaleopsis nitida]
MNRARTQAGATANLPEPPFRGGQQPKGAPKASDYEPGTSKLILSACHHFEVLVVTEDPFPDEATQDRWAKETWTHACKMFDIQYRLTDRVQKLITDRVSHARGALKDTVRPLIPTEYKFSEGSDEDAKVENRALFVCLTDDNTPEPDPRFYYQDPETQRGFAEHAIIKRIIRERWFTRADAMGPSYPQQFSPIRAETLALIFTTIHFCLDQWADGIPRQGAKFWDKDYKPKYQDHIARIKDWINIDTDHAKETMQKLHDDARCASGATPISAPVKGLSATARARLQAERAEREQGA